ncbi:Methyltransferase-like protein 7B [Picochlorum sp. SENEW3]|nr:Methyltransferase-like protein 7B [Picochlorum sp. SENEW3]
MGAPSAWGSRKTRHVKLGHVHRTCAIDYHDTKLPAERDQRPVSGSLVDMTRRQVVHLSCGCLLCAAQSPDGFSPVRTRNSTMDRMFANAMAQGMQEYENAIRPVKQKLFRELNDHLTRVVATKALGNEVSVAEIGIGAGPNLEYYDPNTTRIEAIEPNDFMKAFVEQKLVDLGFPLDGFITWSNAVAEDLPLETESQDAVVCTIVLCSVADVDKALSEFYRILKPGGMLLLIEHTVADEGLLRGAQMLLNPLQNFLADGCNLTRNPGTNLSRIEGLSKDGLLSFSVPGMGLLSPHIAGLLHKKE